MNWNLIAADALLVIHTGFIAFVIGGLLAIYLGALRGWAWVRNLKFRILHLAAIGYVVVQAWLGVICPLTIWEMQFRRAAGGDTYAGSFIQHWLHKLIYYQAPEWVFVVCYTAFGLLVLASWFVVRPMRHQ
ncbi:DUF2784 domain-containing protein [Paraferrimonas sedimenticola]|uniref:DUF2784 domain-containing protein n=1 Tax=Paraferrimonas sedimenticola TaxID=375674 RepID=A0AA37RV42_9GAMM|nr:DUF2784 domain-containing protein [Paraferrimonas sedimenticola]GLP95122.1 hypothetical protein GCM10007895_04280 [Paraferrimonas sedimenticola]